MTTLLIKDSLRAAVEKTSAGRQTVLYTASGQPSFMYPLAQFGIDAQAQLSNDPATPSHPAFVVAGLVRREFFYGVYQGVLRNGELLSLPGQDPQRGLDFDAFSKSARACGPGWHLSTNAEWAALMLWCVSNGFSPRGNSDYGRSIEAAQEQGSRVCEHDPDNAATLGGSGPLSWRHNNSADGIADLSGNLWEWQAGVRLVDGEIQIIADNDALSANLDSCSNAWRSIRLSDGELLLPGNPASAKYDARAPCIQGNAGAPLLSSRVRHRTGEAGSNLNTSGLMDADFNAISTTTGVQVPAILKALGLFPMHEVLDGDQVYLRNYGERLLLRGGAWYSGGCAGLRSLCLSHPRKHASLTVGGRPAFAL
ncbi:MAG: hypothetical protein RSG79_03525 [Pseudomonas sp.]